VSDEDSTPMDLLFLSLPGVQRFISESLSTSHVRAASEIVSHLSRAASDACGAAAAGARVVIPGPQGVGLNAEGAPNRLVVEVPAGQGEPVARSAQAAVDQAWAGWLRKTFHSSVDVSSLRVEGFPRLQWVCVPHSLGGYQVQWGIGTQALASRRRARDFERVDIHDRDLCALSPRWPAVHAPDNVLPHEPTNLSSVNWVKQRWRRIQQHQDGFPSTASIASAPFRRSVLAAMDDSGVREAVAALRQAAMSTGVLPESPVPGLSYSKDALGAWLVTSGGPCVFESWWSVERLADDLGRDKGGITGAVADGARAAKRLAEAMRSRGVPPPSPYLAVIVQDLDNMGSFLSGSGVDAHGERLSQISADSHAQVSTNLQALSRSQRQCLSDDWLGVPVYAGGDDLLAFVPAATALGAARGVHDLVPESLPSASTAVLFFHYHGALQSALRSAHVLLDQAKARVPGKHALAVGYQRRSGASSSTIQPWKTDVIDALQSFATDAAHRISPRLVSDLRRDRGELGRLSTAHAATYTAEIARLVRRHLSGDRERSGERAKALADQLVRLVHTEAAPSLDQDLGPAPGLERLAEVGVFLRQEASWAS
jgi:hypothetical protein